MKMDYIRRFRRTTITDEAGPPPSVWFALKGFLSRFWTQALKKALLPLGVITGLVLGFEQLGWFKHLEATVVDTFSRGQTTKVPRDIVIVEITDDDYKKLFGQRSPLNPNTVIELIKSVGQLNPRVIGVDLDTQDSSWTKANLHSIEDLMPRIVWAGVPEETSAPEANTSDEQQLKALRLMPVLGHEVDPKERQPLVGIVRFPMGTDGFVRSFHCFYPVEKMQTPMPNFFHVVAHKDRGDIGPDLGAEAGEDPYLKFSGDRFNFQRVQASEFIEVDPRPVGKREGPVNPERPGANAQNDSGPDQTVNVNVVVTESDQQGSATQNDVPAKQTLQVQVATELNQQHRAEANKSVASNQQRSRTGTQAETTIRVKTRRIPAQFVSKISSPIVLVGGAYSLGRDEYLTPLGKMAGVELLANAVETEIHGGVRALTWKMAVPLDLLMGTVIVLIYFRLRGKPRAAMVWSIAITLAVPLLIGMVSFYGFTAFLNFVPIMAGMIAHQMYEGTKEAVELQAEVAEKDREIEKLRAELEAARRPAGDIQIPHHTGNADAVPGDSGSVLRTTVVETGTEELHLEDDAKVPRRRRGHAAGSQA